MVDEESNIMKIKNNVEWFNINSVSDNRKLVISMMDDGDWEYDRLGIGKDEKGLFIVDLDDSGEEFRVVNRVKKDIDLDKLLKIGCECKVWRDYKGYDSDDKYRVIMDSGNDEMNRLGKEVLVNGEFSNEYYSLMKK